MLNLNIEMGNVLIIFVLVGFAVKYHLAFRHSERFYNAAKKLDRKIRTLEADEYLGRLNA